MSEKNLIRLNDIFKESSASSASVSASGGFGGASMGGSYEESQSSGFTYFNPQAVGMAVARPYGFEIDFVRNPISGSAS